VDEVRKEILSLANGKSHGLYSCPTQLLKYAHNIISDVLSKIFNMSISVGVYPSKLKMAKIIPIFKHGDSLDANNYRPISLLSNFNKIFEKLMCKRMESFIEASNILSSSQYGFRKAHSTQHAVLDLLNVIQTNMDKSLFSCGIFIDLKKAFDTVDHSILLSKLNYYGFRGIINQWFSSYLQGRTQSTQIGYHVSNKMKVSHGVPQGSVLGPLFLLYINDIQTCSDKFSFYLFADDTNLLYADKNLKKIEQIVNAELQNLNIWLVANRLTLNVKKTNFDIFRPYQKKICNLPKLYLIMIKTKMYL
jgi:hypothetical protein